MRGADVLTARPNVCSREGTSALWAVRAAFTKCWTVSLCSLVPPADQGLLQESICFSFTENHRSVMEIQTAHWFPDLLHFRNLTGKNQSHLHVKENSYFALSVCAYCCHHILRVLDTAGASHMLMVSGRIRAAACCREGAGLSDTVSGCGQGQG